MFALRSTPSPSPNKSQKRSRRCRLLLLLSSQRQQNKTILLHYHLAIIQAGIMSSPTPPPPQQASRPVPSYKAYTGPDPSTIAVQRSKAEAERYWARMSRKADESVLPVRVNKALGFGGWIAGTSRFISFIGHIAFCGLLFPHGAGIGL